MPDTPHQPGKPLPAEGMVAQHSAAAALDQDEQVRNDGMEILGRRQPAGRFPPLRV